VKSYTCPGDLEQFGFRCLTGEACGLTMRLLYDVNLLGKRILEYSLGDIEVSLREPWNGGEFNAGSVMLTYDMARTCAIFGMLGRHIQGEKPCLEVWELYDDGRLTGQLYGLETQEEIDLATQYNIGCGKDASWRKWRLAGTAGDRNVHVMSGRVA